MIKKSIENSAQDNMAVDELSEDIEVVGPGQMLAEGRVKLSLSVEDVANKLKFTQNLVQKIEQDIFDQKLPATYNRGYLRSYAKLVNIDVQEVLSAYDMLDVAEIQRSEMQSFSNLTEKQAEHSRLMWFSYLIVAILFGLMVLWWLQAPKTVVEEKTTQVPTALTSEVVEKAASVPNTLINQSTSELAESNQLSEVEIPQLESDLLLETESTTQTTDDLIINEPAVDLLAQATEENTLEVNQEPDFEVGTAVFTFTGDCWVNIFDAAGERIAWGVKKSGYEMTISGKMPLKVTLGRPELASIIFNGQAVDMSPFNVGNIAKFTLPINL